MKLMFFFLFFFFISCRRDSTTIKYEYYFDGKTIKSQTTYLGKIKEGLAKTFYYGGSVKEMFYYSNDSLSDKYVSYDIYGNIKSKSFFWRNKPVGPNFIYENSKLRLYNESEYLGGIYYVKKYDSLGILIKEEGLAICPNFYSDVNSDSATISSFISLYCFYAQPDGYENNLKAFINNSAVELKLLPSHMGLIEAKLDNKRTYEFKVVSQLRNNGKMICQDSCIRSIVVY